MKTILFGAGEMTEKFLCRKEFFQYNIQVVADNDQKKHDLLIHSADRCYRIISPNDILTYDYDIIIVTIANYAYQLDIMTQLIGIGISKDKIYFLRNWRVVKGVRLLDELREGIPLETLLFDVTNITGKDTHTGIQRVVRELYENMLALEAKAYPVQFVNDKWITSREFYCRMEKKKFDHIEYKVTNINNTIFLPDASWENYEMLDSLELYANSVFVIYDLIPILYPETAWKGTKKVFEKWINGIIKKASKCVCISKYVADTFVEYYNAKKIKRNSPLKIYTIHLGFDMAEVQGYVRNELKEFVNREKTFLIVGTVEPRKNQLLLLNSIKKISIESPDEKIQLLILGRDGWSNDEFKNMYATDNEIRKRVLWIKDATDNEVQWAYRNSSALVFPTKVEGFGLPLVEAAHFQLPIICSDIPVFREIAGDNVDYFTVDDVDSLSEALIRWLKADSHPDSSKIKMYTWKECAKEVLDIINDKAEPYAVLE